MNERVKVHIGTLLPSSGWRVHEEFTFQKRCLINIHCKTCRFPSPQKQLQLDEGQNALMKKVLDTYLLFFQINQSTATLRHVFAALRLFVQKVRHPRHARSIQKLDLLFIYFF